ncbi:MAG: GNAT family N-acetyltransferase [Longimicrobiales bacterium]
MTLQLADKLGRPFRIRPYTPADRRTLELMYTDFRPKRAAQGLPPDSELGLRVWLDRVLRAGEHLVVEVVGELAGHGFLLPLAGAPTGTAELANFLHQAIRERGIGTALNRALVERARALGYSRVWLSVEPWNRAALRSYRNAGFQLLPGSYWAPEIEMEVRLDAEPLVVG